MKTTKKRQDNGETEQERDSWITKDKRRSTFLRCTNTRLFSARSHKANAATVCSRSHDSVLTGGQLNSSHIVYGTVSPDWPSACTLFGAKWAPRKTLLKTFPSRLLGFRAAEEHCSLCALAFPPLSTQVHLDSYLHWHTIAKRNFQTFIEICKQWSSLVFITKTWWMCIMISNLREHEVENILNHFKIRLQKNKSCERSQVGIAMKRCKGQVRTTQMF